MLFLKSLIIWFLTVLTGSIVESIFIGGSEIWDAFIPSFLLLALFGGILSTPSILINWFGLYTALSFKSSFDRLIFLGMVNIMATLAVLAITYLIFDMHMEDIFRLTWPFIIASFVFLYSLARNIIYQPYPEFHKEQNGSVEV